MEDPSGALTRDAPEAEGPRGIALVPFGSIDPSLLTFLAGELETVSGRRVMVLPLLPLPEAAYDARRKQYRAMVFLQRLLPLKAEGWERLLGIADVDLYVPGLNFVFGEADPMAGVAVFSLFRLRPASGLPEARDRFRRRILTEAVHELGHTYGLGHCPDPACVMCFSNSLADTDRKEPAFCERCQAGLLHKRRMRTIE